MQYLPLMAQNILSAFFSSCHQYDELGRRTRQYRNHEQRAIAIRAGSGR
jgi:hypothetical protein